MATIDLKKTIKGLSFFTRNLKFFGGKQKTGDQFVFDQRGAIRITDKQITRKNGEIVKIRGVQDAGGSSMVITRPSSGMTIDASHAMDSYHSWPYAAIKPIADEIAGIEWKFYKVVNKKPKEIDEHEIIDFLETVNETQTGPEFKHLLACHLELTGNAYILLDGVKNATDKPTAMHLLDPGKVQIILDKTTYPYKVTKYKFTYDGRFFYYEPHEILQIRYPNPSNQHMGLGTVQGAAEWIDNDNNATEFLRQFFLNGAQIGVTFETDMTSEEQLQELLDAFKEQHAGVHNAYKTMALPKGVKRTDSGVKFDDIGYDTISDTNRDKILAAFRVPKTIVGAAESIPRANAETADYIFARRTIKPKMILITSFLNHFLIPRFAPDIFLSFEDPVTEDKVQTSQLMKNSVNGLPVMTANEAREEYLNMEPVEGGDKLLAPNNYAPAGEVDTIQLPATSGEEPKKSKRSKAGYMPIHFKKTRTQFSKSFEMRETMSSLLSKRIIDVITSIKKKKIHEMNNQEYDTVVLKEKSERVSKYSERMKEELRRLNAGQKREVMENLETAIKTAKAVNPKKLFDKQKWVNFTIDGMTPIAADLFTKEAKAALELIDAPGLDVQNTPAAKTAIDRAMSLMAESYNQDTVDILQSKLEEGLAQGYGVSELGDLITDIYDWKDQYAAERVALTESNRITNEAGKIAWKETGLVKEITWITSGRDNVCPLCQAQDGKTISIEDNFFDKGDLIEGTDGEVSTADYSDIGGPPMHPNCHCGIKPVYIPTEELAAPKRDELDEAIEDLQHA